MGCLTAEREDICTALWGEWSPEGPFCFSCSSLDSSTDWRAFRIIANTLEPEGKER